MGYEGKDKDKDDDKKKQQKDDQMSERASQMVRDQSIMARLAGAFIGIANLFRDMLRTVLYGSSYAMRTRDEFGNKLDTMKRSDEIEQGNKKVEKEPSLQYGHKIDERDIPTKEQREEEPILKGGEVAHEEEASREDAESSLEHTEVEEGGDAKESEPAVEDEMIDPELQKHMDIFDGAVLVSEAAERENGNPNQELLARTEKIHNDIMESMREEWKSNPDKESRLQNHNIIMWMFQSRTEQLAVIDAYCRGEGDLSLYPSVESAVCESAAFHEQKYEDAMRNAMEKGIEESDSFSDAVRSCVKANPSASPELLADMAKDWQEVKEALSDAFHAASHGSDMSDAVKESLADAIKNTPALDGFTPDNLWEHITSCQDMADQDMREDQIVHNILEDGITNKDIMDFVEKWAGEEQQENEIDDKEEELEL